MMKGLKRLAGGGLFLRELRSIRLELGRIATALELSNAHHWPQQASSTPAEDLEPTTISYVNNAEQAELAEIELAMTRRMGIPPSEDEVMAEFNRRYQEDQQG